jgi:hypothetical protein
MPDSKQQELEAVERQGAFFASLNHVLVAGRKPSDH